MVAAVLDSRVRVPNPMGNETVLRMVGWCGKVLKLCNMGMNKHQRSALKKRLAEKFGVSVSMPVIQFIEKEAVKNEREEVRAKVLREQERRMDMNLGYDS